MIKYILKNLPLPMDMVNEIYSFIDPLRQIKNLPPIWYKRLIGREFHLYADFGPTFLKHLFKNEEAMLSILKKNNAYNLITNMHLRNLGL